MATYTPIELPMTVASDTPTLSMSVAGNLVIGGHVPVLQTKTVYPSSTDQTIEPDIGYDALDEVDVMAVVVTNLSAANIVDGVTVKVGDANDDDSIASVTGTAEAGINPTGTLSVTSNGTKNVYSYQYAEVNVPNTYAAGDEGKVVRSGELVSQTSATYTTNNTYDTTTINSVTVSVSGGGGATLGTKTITAHDTYDASDDDLDGYSQVTVAVPASAVDTGTKSITANGNNQDVVGYAAVNVAVPNTYSAGDEGKVVSNGALVAQGSDTVTTNDTYDTTLISSLTVNVSGGGGGTATIGLLTTINITSPVATITYDLPALAADYGMVWVVCDNLVLSAKDYMYFAVVPSNAAPSDNSGYIQTTTFDSSIICSYGAPRTVGGVSLPGFTASNYTNTGSTNRVMRVADTPNVLKGKLYASATRFNSGTLYVYGRTA